VNQNFRQQQRRPVQPPRGVQQPRQIPRVAIPPNLASMASAQVQQPQVQQPQPQVAVKTPAQEYAERYAQICREADTLGRIIGVGMLKVSQQIRVMEMTPALDGQTEVGIDKDGKKIVMARRSLPMLAAAVREIDGVKYMFPRNRQELDFMLDRLDGPGLIAAGVAAAKIGVADIPTAPAMSEEEEEELEVQEDDYGEEAA
jgi:hypothetical protein